MCNTSIYKGLKFKTETYLLVTTSWYHGCYRLRFLFTLLHETFVAF